METALGSSPESLDLDIVVYVKVVEVSSSPGVFCDDTAGLLQSVPQTVVDVHLVLLLVELQQDGLEVGQGRPRLPPRHELAMMIMIMIRRQQRLP